MSLPYRTDDVQTPPPAASWGPETDSWRWELNPPPAPMSGAALLAQVREDMARLDALQKRYEALVPDDFVSDEVEPPDDSDRSWAAELSEEEQVIHARDYDAWLDLYEGYYPLESRGGPVTDQDLAAAGLPVG